jgi:hypothetical protein
MNNFDPSKQPSNYKQFRHKVVEDAVNRLVRKWNPQLSAVETLLMRAQEVTFDVHQNITPILKAGGATDKQALLELATKFYLDGFRVFSKDELVVIISRMHLDIISDIIDADPGGKGKPDLLSGL